ncbi:MAG: UDP-N-acetylmuramoylalanine--D-glutamate ligase [Candidatus Tokpelaia sp. JSC161]|nr:MAG: UDP-N-acetylmuramoylalanine--D-glutamate ligase [Candidatus Tokpelaia sp. JSC161]
MIPVYSFSKKKVFLFGLGCSGLQAALALKAGGADVIAWDDDVLAIKNACSQGLIVEDLRRMSWDEVSVLILSPGVQLTDPEPHWVVEIAQKYNVKIIGDIQLFVEERNAFLKRVNLRTEDCPFIAITGTNGKSTTTALIGYLLKKAGYDVWIGGNIGTAVLSLPPFMKGRIYVIECSSYQIDLAPSINPTIGILLNVTLDHIDRHGTFKSYQLLKKRLISGSDKAVLAIDDPFCLRIYEDLLEAGKIVYPLKVGNPLKDGYFSDRKLILHAQAKRIRILASLEDIPSLRGDHNMQNTLAALACCDLLGIDRPHSLASFKGLSHRMEEIARKRNVLFINDSKATNAEASAAALATFNSIYWIAGGVAKEGGIYILRKFFSKMRKVYFIGEAGPVFAREIGEELPIVMAGTLAKAVLKAGHDALCDTEDSVVLFSPACASFDQFTDYQVRGDSFRKAVYDCFSYPDSKI